MNRVLMLFFVIFSLFVLACSDDCMYDSDSLPTNDGTIKKDSKWIIGNHGERAEINLSIFRSEKLTTGVATTWLLTIYADNGDDCPPQEILSTYFVSHDE